MELTASYMGGPERPLESAISVARSDLSAFEQRVPAEIKKALLIYLQLVADKLVTRHGNAWPGGTTEKSLSKRSGKSIQSIRDSVQVTGGGSIENIVGRIGGSGTLRIHETGGVIKVKNAEYLTIPLPAALDSQGIPKKRRARDWQNTFVAKSKNGNLIIFQKNGAKIIPLYVLKKEVKIPARLGMRNTLEKEMPVLSRNLQRAVNKAWGQSKAS